MKSVRKGPVEYATSWQPSGCTQYKVRDKRIYRYFLIDRITPLFDMEKFQSVSRKNVEEKWQ